MEKVGAIWHHVVMATDDQFPSDFADRFQVRMPPGLRDRLKSQAEANKRSMNAEIVARLEASFPSAVVAEAFKDMSPEAAILAEKIVERVIERVERFRVEADAEIKALQEENRKLREAASSQSPGS